MVVGHEGVDSSPCGDSFLEAGGIGLGDIVDAVNFPVLLALLNYRAVTVRKYFRSLLLLATAPSMSYTPSDKSYRLFTLLGIT